MRKLFAVIAIASAGLALAACTGERFSGSPSAGSSAANSLAYERPAPIARAPLSPPAGYASQPGYGASPGYASSSNYGPSPGYGPPQGYGSRPPLGGSPAPLAPYGNSRGYGSQGYGGAPDTAALGGWRASPRWSAVQGDGCIEVEQDGEASRAGAGARGVRIETCSNRPQEIGEGTPAGIMPQAAY